MPGRSCSIRSALTRPRSRFDRRGAGRRDRVGRDALGFLKRRVHGDLEKFKETIERQGGNGQGWRGEVPRQRRPVRSHGGDHGRAVEYPVMTDTAGESGRVSVTTPGRPAWTSPQDVRSPDDQRRDGRPTSRRIIWNSAGRRPRRSPDGPTRDRGPVTRLRVLPRSRRVVTVHRSQSLSRASRFWVALASPVRGGPRRTSKASATRRIATKTAASQALVNRSEWFVGRPAVASPGTNGGWSAIPSRWSRLPRSRGRIARESRFARSGAVGRPRSGGRAPVGRLRPSIRARLRTGP